jgi:hypothetical protein
MALGRVLINRQPNANLDAPPNLSGHGADLSVCPLMTQSGDGVAKDFSKARGAHSDSMEAPPAKLSQVAMRQADDA